MSYSDEDLDRRLDGKAEWEYVRKLEHRIDELETWRAASQAVSAARRWAVPVTLSVLGGMATLVNLVLAATRAH